MSEQTSASDRYAAARKALKYYDSAALFAADPKGHPSRSAARLANALRALITPPSTEDGVEAIVANIMGVYGDRLDVTMLMKIAVRAGIQDAHNSWEPEVALRPTQEQMLRWLGIEHTEDPAVGMLFIREQYIEQED